MLKYIKIVSSVVTAICLIPLFQNCSGGFEATHMAEFASMSSTAPALNVVGAPPSLSNSRNISLQIAVTVNQLATLKSVTCTLDTNTPVDCKNTFSSTNLSDGDHRLKIQAIDSLNNPSEDFVAIWKIDATVPTVTFSQAPPAVSGSKDVTASFAANESSTYECSLDAAAFATCVSPLNLKGLTETSHTLKVRAKDAASNISADLISTFKVDLTTPTLTLLTKPASPSGATSAVFTFSGTDDGMAITAFSCKVDALAIVACNAGTVTFNNLNQGSHTFTLTGQDSAGNMSATTTYTWTVDTTAPTLPVIVSNITSPTKSQSITFQFSSTDASGIKNYNCQLDNNASEVCAANVAKTYSALSAAAHTFKVQAVDQAGNTSAFANFSWTVESPAPTVTPTPTPSFPPGSPGCGLSAAAFCDTFDAPASNTTGRSFELDSNRWGLSRNLPNPGSPHSIGTAKISNCRPGLDLLTPGADTRICNGNSKIASNHLITAASSLTADHNYGSSTYRIRQPFDFAGRTGKVVFDADATGNDLLLGWIAIAVTEDPMPSPGFSITPGAGNFEGGVIPKNGFTIELGGYCGNNDGRVIMINEYRNYVDHVTYFSDNGGPCIDTEFGHLNRFELKLSQNKVELWASPYSANGTVFGALKLVATANLNLSFSRGYVSMIVRNHATVKYSANHAMDAQVVRWDNIGFDGPVVTNAREFEVPDSLVSVPQGGVAIGYSLAGTKALTIRNVTGVAQATRARIAFNVMNPINSIPSDVVFKLNGKMTRTYNYSLDEQNICSSGVTLAGDRAGKALIIGVMGIVTEVPVSDLIEGDNKIEFTGTNQVISNVDLILDK